MHQKHAPRDRVSTAIGLTDELTLGVRACLVSVSAVCDSSGDTVHTLGLPDRGPRIR